MQSPASIVNFEQKAGYLWIMLPDSIHMDNYKRIESEIEERLAGHERIVLDFTATKSLYSSGIGMMIRMRRTVAERKGFICCVNVSEHIRTLLTTVNLDRLFPIYATDVEFEISQEDVWAKKVLQKEIAFVFVAQIENGIYRINLSGQMKLNEKLSQVSAFAPDPAITVSVFDLTGLEVMDSHGIQVLLQLLDRIGKTGGKCVAYGAPENIREFIDIMGISNLMAFYDTERDALESVNKA